MGHYHVAHQLRDNAWYPGALEYVSPNPWGELKDEARAGREGQKGWLLVELGRGLEVTFRPVALARRLVDLPALHAGGLGVVEIDRGIAERVEAVEHGIDDQIVRQVVHGVPRPVRRELNHAQIREFKTRALHYHLDLRSPEPHREVGVGAPGARQTLVDTLVDYLRRRPLDVELDRDRLVALGKTYMDDVERALREE